MAVAPIDHQSSTSKSDRDRPKKKHKSKDEKKSGSKDSSKQEKKRKRANGEDSERHKSKKLRQEKVEDVTENVSALHHVSQSPFHTQTSSLYLPLSPISQRKPIEGMCAEHLSPLILTYYPPLGGVVLSYSSPRLAEQPFRDDGTRLNLQCIDEYGASYAWLSADFLLFRPRRGEWLEGYISLQNEGHIGLVCWNLFNASIERRRLPETWKWSNGNSTREADDDIFSTEVPDYLSGEASHYVDTDGNKVSGLIKFRVKDVESSHDRERGFLNIMGTMLDVEAEKSLVEQEYSLALNSTGRDRGRGGGKSLGATSLGVSVDNNHDRMDGEGGGVKHRHAY